MPADSLRIGIVGVGGHRGSDAFTAAIEYDDLANVTAICDVDEEALTRASEHVGAEQTYVDYKEMIRRADLEAVIIATPMHLHAEQSVFALKRGVNVLSEVPAVVSLEGARSLVAAVKETDAQYMMLENYLFNRSNMMISRMVDAGHFGETYYGQGVTIGNLFVPRGPHTANTWRREWIAGVNGVTYPTHTLGPLLEWMDARVDRISCMGSGHHYEDEGGRPFESEDTTLLSMQTEAGHAIEIREDYLSNRPGGRRYELQGTKGCFESTPASTDGGRVWMESICEDLNTWKSLSSLEEEFLPEEWRNPPMPVANGERGDDFFATRAFLESVSTGESVPVGVHRALDMTLPGVLSVESIEADGAWVTVPDSRDW